MWTGSNTEDTIIEPMSLFEENDGFFIAFKVGGANYIGYIKKTVFPSVAALLECMPVQQYLMLVKEAATSENAFRKRQEIVTDFRNADKHSPELKGFERFSLYIEDEEYHSFLLELRRARDYNVAAAVANAAKISAPSSDCRIDNIKILNDFCTLP